MMIQLKGLHKDALENVALPLFYQGVSRRKRNTIAMEYLDKVGLRDWAHHLPNEMSGGQKNSVSPSLVPSSHTLKSSLPTNRQEPSTARPPSK